MAILVAINTSLDNLVFIKVIAYPYSCNFIYFSEDSSKFFFNNILYKSVSSCVIGHK